MIETPAISFSPDSPYRRLARTLDALPNRFPAAADGSDLRLLAKLYSPEEAALAADLLPEAESPAQIATRLARDPAEVTGLLKEMTRKGLIAFGKTPNGRPGFRLMPFVVGIYEAQNGRVDAELARLFETYYRSAFGSALEVTPQLHRVIPVRESIPNTMEIAPYESVTALLDSARSWGVIDCICRTQKALIGEPCGHPVDVCMTLSSQPDAFARESGIRSLTRDEAQAVLQRAAEAGLVHSVSNNQRDLTYICNCCTCSCSILRGMADLGIANVVARSAFVNQVDEALCAACGTCVDACMFTALSVDLTAQVNEQRCVGCGVCVPLCPEDALKLVRRTGEAAPPLTEEAWRAARSAQM